MWRFWIFLLPTVVATGVRADAVDDYIKTQMGEHRIAGICFLVAQTNQVIKRTAYGLANVELNVPATPKTVFEIGSMTKQFTAACILLLAQENKLSVDDKVSQHLAD